MSARKKWRLKLIPPIKYRSMPSQKKAYEFVAEYRYLYALGMTNVHHIDVQVHEDSGEGWSLYERIVFPPREPS